mgnify:CR=1 FL=1
MNLQLEQKVALVCASSAGIGKAIAKGLAEEGVHVSILARTPNTLEAAYAEISKVARGKVMQTVCDVANSKDIAAVCESTQSKLGPIDILINNQGGPAPGSLFDVTNEQLDSAIDTNIKAVFQFTKFCLPGMKQRRCGRVLNVLSISAKEPLPGMLLSNVMRPAILGFAKTLATEYAAAGVTINSLLPSAVMTARATRLMEARAKNEGVDLKTVVANASKGIPIGYIASPEEFAQLAVFLCSPNASYINGAAIAVDGGSNRGLF